MNTSIGLEKHFLVVGYGSIGKRHVKNIREMYPDAVVSVLRHQDSLSEEIMCEAGISNCFTSLKSATDSKPLLAIIASPATKHIDTAISMAECGIHLLIEKPLSADLSSVDILINICHKRGVCLMVGYNLRFLPSLQKFRMLLQGKVVGEIFSVRAEVGQNLQSWRPSLDYKESVSAKHALGGGVLLELSHEIDYLLWLFQSITAVTGIAVNVSNMEIDVEDCAHLILQFQPLNNKEMYGTLSMDFVRLDPVRSCLVVGEKGSLRWDCLRGIVEQFQPEENRWNQVYNENEEVADSYKSELSHFVDCIQEKKAPSIGGEDGRRVLTVIDAIRRSSKTKCLCSVQ